MRGSRTSSCRSVATGWPHRKHGALWFLTDIHQQADLDWNPGNLPVGFARYYDEKAGAELLDFTCSLCHTGELHYQGTAIRIDGGRRCTQSPT